MNREQIRQRVERLAHREVSDDDFRAFVEECEVTLENTVQLADNIVETELVPDTDADGNDINDYRLPDDFQRLVSVSHVWRSVAAGSGRTSAG